MYQYSVSRREGSPRHAGLVPCRARCMTCMLRRGGAGAAGCATVPRFTLRIHRSCHGCAEAREVERREWSQPPVVSAPEHLRKGPGGRDCRVPRALHRFRKLHLTTARCIRGAQPAVHQDF